ncbi:MAG: MG2 domain-containing protein, partial [Alphaproteobacteria bacterium]
MNRWLPAAFVAALVVIAGIAYLLIAKPHFGGKKSTTQTTEQTAEGGEPAGSASGPRLPPIGASMTFQRLNVDTSGDRPEACLVFSQTLDPSGNTNYSDYVKLDPDVQHSVRVNGSSLCIGGLEYAKDYSAKILVGLPSISGQKTTYEETVPIALADRPAAVAFSGGIILPRESEGKIPVTSVNIASMKIKILRVGDRLLARLTDGLVDSSSLYDYDASQIEDEMGALVWQGTMAVQGKKNETVTTLIPLHDVLKSAKSGVYLVLASDAKAKDNLSYDDNGTAAQWVIDTDIGLTSFQGADGLHVFARSLSTAKPISGVQVALIARNNEELGRIRTDGSGEASFNADLIKGTGGNTPVVVMAYGGADFAYLDLRRAAFDLSDRGVSGRDQPGPVDAYLYLDRGIYRPGESVYVTTLLRDTFVNSITNSPLTLIATRPDGIEYRRIQLNGAQAKAGAYAASFPLSASAPRGRWQIAAYVDPTGDAIGRVTFDVQDFVPERLKVTLAPKAAFYKPGDEVQIGVEGRYLYGAPASNLTGEGEMRVSVDYNPFPNLKDYYFGREEEPFQDQVITLQVDTTDSNGKTTATGTLDLPNATTHPLVADIGIGLTEPGGRLTRQKTSVPIRTGNVMLGIHPVFDDGWVRENTAANFEVLAVDGSGKQIAKGDITYRIVREVVNYQWYQKDGKWEWERQTRDLPVADGKISAAPNAPGKIATTQGWGEYRVIVADNASGASSSYEYYVGWGGSASNDRPDRVSVALDKEKYKPGEKATLTIHPPTDGKALILIASDRVYQTVLMDVPATGATYSFTVDAKWGTGVYALVESYRGTGVGNSRAPVRAIGLSWLSIDQSDRTIAVNVKAPDKVKPQSQVDIPVQVQGAHGATYITLAAVDEGI